jgi:phage anti-repressor protein
MSNNPLIPVFTGQINNESVQLVDARLLHSFMEVARDFSTWITDRIKQYGFVENQDFIRIFQNREIENSLIPQNGGIKKSRGGDRRSIHYHLSLNMAKELSMVERNAKGKEARRYFIECEKRLLGQVPDHIAKAYDELVMNKIPEYLKVITAPLSVAEFEERYHFHENALECLQNAQVIMPARDFLKIKQDLQINTL